MAIEISRIVSGWRSPRTEPGPAGTSDHGVHELVEERIVLVPSDATLRQAAVERILQQLPVFPCRGRA
jgi:hypothetical protein